MINENWGVGNRKDEKAYDTTVLGTGIDTETVELIFGEHPHSRQDNTTYARTKSGAIYDFDGHRMCFKIEVEEYNYLKTSGLSGDQIRKACTGKLFLNGIQIYDTWHRDYERCYGKIQKFIADMEEKWSFFPFKTEKEIGRTIGYHEQLFKIDRFIIEQGCMIISTLDGKPRKPFLWEDEEDYEDGVNETLKVGITSDSICWFPKVKS